MMESRHFTLEEARRMLPWLESKLVELDPYRAEIERCRKRAGDLMQMTRNNGHGDVDAELHHMQSMAQELQKSIEDILSQIIARGIVVRDIERGLVDFPALKEKRTIHLCWVRGETDIAFWHETNTGYSGRQPL